MATPIIRGNNNQSSRSKEPEKVKMPVVARRFAAWAVEISLVVASGLVPFGLGVYADSRSELNRVPLNPILVTTERAIARPLALPVSYGIRNVAWPTNFLWTVALIAPVTLSWWQLYLLGKSGSTLPKRWFGIKVVNEEGQAPGLGAVVVREGLGRWSVPLSIAYLLWRYSFAFPNLTLFTSIAVLMVLGEALGWPTQKRRRAFHDVIAGTYSVDSRVSRPVKPPVNNENTSSPSHPPTAVTRNSPNRTLFLVGLTSMIAVLTTLVSTQVYIQAQQSSRRNQQVNSQKFQELFKQLNANPGMYTEERQRIILAMGGLNDQQTIKFLVDLLTKETDPKIVDTIQQALVNSNFAALDELKRMNQFLAAELDATGNSPSRELQQKQFVFNQQVINKILAVNSGKMEDLDLSKVQLGQNRTSEISLFNLVLDNTDLSGANFKAANLNQGSFKGTRFRSVGEDGKWDTYDDAIADLSQAELKQVDFTNANLSRVPLFRSDLSRATLNKANLSHARLMGSNLSSAQLVSTDLRKAILENAVLTGADLTDAQLTEANLFAARLVRAFAIGTQLSYANLAKTDWQGADISEAYLDHANLSNANLSAARLTGTVLRSANLENASLRNADLSRADLQGANVAGADFQGAILFPSKPDSTDQFVQTPDHGAQAAIVKGVDFNDAKNLDHKQLAFICTQGGIHLNCP
ncbi:MAG TPA: pentapeptide repeat-containing protein [Nostocaceae cyanobacterium]|nr:pentapeptide repeat-containing protein [Nostocaceae cyanobacterium]